MEERLPLSPAAMPWRWEYLEGTGAWHAADMTREFDPPATISPFTLLRLHSIGSVAITVLTSRKGSIAGGEYLMLTVASGKTVC